MGDSCPVGEEVVPAVHEKDRTVGRLFAILTAIQEAGATATLSGIVRETGLPKSTVHRLLADLLDHGVVSRKAHRYDLGPTVRQLATSTQDHGAWLLRCLMKPLLISLHEQTRWMVTLAVPRHAATVKFVDLVYGHEYSDLAMGVAESLPLQVSAAGRVLLAHDPDLLVALARRVGWCSPDVGELCVPPRLATELSRIRRLGVAMGDELGSGMATLAVPVTGPAGRPVAALVVGAHRRNGVDQSGMRHLVRQAGVQAGQILARQHVEHRVNPWSSQAGRLRQV